MHAVKALQLFYDNSLLLWIISIDGSVKHKKTGIIIFKNIILPLLGVLKCWYVNFEAYFIVKWKPNDYKKKEQYICTKIYKL